MSGGPDSVALLHLLKGSSYPLVVGHVDHGLRHSSRADARFVRDLAKSWDLPCLVSRHSVKTYAKAHHLGIEEAARDVRYAALAAMARKCKAGTIVTAHTLDDQAETILMNFLRGAGGAGLAGIPEIRLLSPGSKVILVRPLLGAAKVEILAYLKRHHLRFRQDPTNRSDRFTRNRIRQQVLPLLDLESPGLSRRLARSAPMFRDEEDFWAREVSVRTAKMARKTSHGWTVVLRGLFGYHKALIRRIFRHLLPGVSFQDIEQVLQLASTTKSKGIVVLPGGWNISRRGMTLSGVRKRI